MLCGVLALQGAFAAHQRALLACGAEVRLLRKPEHMQGLDALVLPGGESTTMLHLLHSSGLWDPLSQQLAEGKPVLATCAGLILLARSIRHYPQQQSFSLLDVEVERNGYGRQIESRAAYLAVAALGAAPLPVFFIRAPRILHCGAQVEVLARYQQDPVLLQQGKVLAATFHSELTLDLRLHRYFLSLA